MLRFWVDNDNGPEQMNTLYWHDYETFGINPARDKPSQFAGIRTNEQLEVIGDPLVLFCQPPNDSLPSPTACLVTGITPQNAEQQGIPEPDFISQIHQQLSQPDTCTVGYNNIRFDDEVTRYCLYRNFYDPYEREWKNGNSRWDIIDMIRLTRALRPEGIEWPDRAEGGPDFRLESLTQANGISHDSAHDALSDVLATIALAKLIKSRQPKLYDYVYSFRSKQKVAELVNQFQPKPFLHVSSRLPRENGYTGILLPVAAHPKNKNAIICFNLSGDVTPLIEWEAERIKARLFIPTEDLPEGESRILLKAVHLNKCPVVGTVKLLDSAAANRLNINLETCEQNWQRLKQQDLSKKLAAVFDEEFATAINDPEQTLYQGFLPGNDKALLQQVRNMNSQDFGDHTPMFQDKRYQQLLFLYQARYFPETLNSEQKALWLAHRKSRIIEGEQGYLSLHDFYSELETLTAEIGNANSSSMAKASLLKDLQAWAEKISIGL